MNEIIAVTTVVFIPLLHCDSPNDNNQASTIDGKWISDTDTLSISNRTIYSYATKTKNDFELLNDCYLRRYLNDGTVKICVYESRNDSLRITFCPTDSKPYHSSDHDGLIGNWVVSDSMSIEFKSDTTLTARKGNVSVDGSYTRDKCKLIMRSFYSDQRRYQLLYRQCIRTYRYRPVFRFTACHSEHGGLRRCRNPVRRA